MHSWISMMIFVFVMIRTSWENGIQITNTNIADVVLIFDWALQRNSTDHGRIIMSTKHTETLLQAFKSTDIVSEMKMRVAIVDQDDCTVKLTLEQGVVGEKVLQKWNGFKIDQKNVQISDAGSIHVDCVPAATESGDREFAPNIFVYFQIYPTAKKDQRDNDWFQEVHQFMKTTANGREDFEVNVIVAGYYDKALAVIKRYNGGIELININDLGKRLISAIQEILKKCLVTKEEKQCYYDQTQRCMMEVEYRDRIDIGTDPRELHFCLGGTTNIPCEKKNEQCDQLCKKVQIQFCNCTNAVGTKGEQQVQQKVAEGKEKLYEFCQLPTPVPCYECKTTPPPYMYELRMPIWAVVIITICVMVIVGVFATLVVYFGFFPEAKEAKRTGRAHRWYHIHRGPAGHGRWTSFMQSFQSFRRGSRARRPPSTTMTMTATTTQTEQTIGGMTYTDQSRPPTSVTQQTRTRGNQWATDSRY